MRDLMKSMIGFSWALSLLGVRRMGDLLSWGGVSGPKNDGADEVRSALGVLPPGGTDGPQARPARSVDRGRLDTSTFLVLGEGLAAGMGHFTLNAESQRMSFPALMADRMQTSFAQPLLQAAGLWHDPGTVERPVIVHGPLQTTVLEQCPPLPLSNLSVPGLTLHDALHLRPRAPLIHRRNVKQTAVNLFWGALPLARGDEGPLPTQLQYAIRREPTFAIVALGYSEVLEAVECGDEDALPDVDGFRSDYQQLMAELIDSGAAVLAVNVPNPMDTAYACSLETAAGTLKVPSEFIRETYGLAPDDLVTVHGLNEIGFQLFGRAIHALPAGSVRSPGFARTVSARVGELNAAIDAVAREHATPVFDLRGLFARVRGEGVRVGSRRLTAAYLGGFYSLGGAYPGATGHAIIANELLALLNRVHGARLEALDLQTVLRADPVAGCRPAEGPSWSTSQLPFVDARGGSAGALARGASPLEAPRERRQERGRSSAGPPPLTPSERAPAAPLRLPPTLEQTLALNKAASYFGDGIAAQNCVDEQGARWGSGGSLVFGGLAIVDSLLAGHIRMKFTPLGDDLARFTVSFGDGLVGDDAVLVAPQSFKMAFQQSRVFDVPGQVSSGTLNLANGEVSDLKVYAQYASTALQALVSVNPTFPRQPLSFPGPYGSAWAKFEQRDDGNLDFTFYGSAFVPLGAGIVWPLNFVGPSLQFATIPASGTVMHPHLHLCTKDREEPAASDDPPDIPFNSVQELTLYTHNSSFGDAFTLDCGDLGGPAKGRSHILGRVQLQFGARCGDGVPVAISHLDAGGVLNELSPSPITAVFPGRLYPGPRGFNEFLRFPLRTYSLDDLAILDDPFDISMGMVDLKTGRFVNELLHRAFINQDLIFALLRVEPRTPKDSFFFRGPARLQRGSRGEMVFRHQAAVRVPYPEGFLFPKPNLTTGVAIGPSSVLDPFLWVRAIEDAPAARAVKEGRGDDVTSSGGERFSYRYRISSTPEKAEGSFEYQNHTQKGTFRLRRLSWVGLSRSIESDAKDGEFDTVTFSGFGIWNKDGIESLQQAAVQISTSRKTPYVGIQIGSGDVSDVNTKPEVEANALP